MKRVQAFRPSPAAEDFLGELNRLVEHGEANVEPQVTPGVPVVLVVGPPRSGTTLLMQWLQNVGFGVPTNIAARFFSNPLFAGMLQRLLTEPELNFRDELTIPSSSQFESDYGKTAGPLSPHEFSYFFRRYFPVVVGEQLTAEQLARCDVKGFLEATDRFGSGVGRPVAMKALLVQYGLEVFSDAPNVVLLHSRRNEVDNVRSLFNHRERVAGNSSEWISVRPPGYEWLKDLSPLQQVAGQVALTNDSITRQLVKSPGLTSFTVEHSAFCADPSELHARLRARLVDDESGDIGAYAGPSSFTVRTYPADPMASEIEQALDFVRVSDSQRTR